MPCETQNFQAEAGPRDSPTTRNRQSGEPGARAAAGGQGSKHSLLGCENLSAGTTEPACSNGPPSEQSS